MYRVPRVRIRIQTTDMYHTLPLEIRVSRLSGLPRDLGQNKLSRVILTVESQNPLGGLAPYGHEHKTINKRNNYFIKLHK